MKKQLSDEQLDQMMRNVMNDAALDDAAVDNVADSPTLWWAVQRQINREKDLSKSPWPPVGNFWRWLMLGVPAGAAAAVLITLFAFQPAPLVDDVAVSVAPVSDQVRHTLPSVNQVVDTNFEAPRAETDNRSTGPVNPLPTARRLVAAKHIESKRLATNRILNLSVARKSTEIKTDFIALSYARNPDSGQIVRVRVPSSMMVTLGLVTSVTKPSNLVDAEVLVGDDGLTRAIRFIR